VVPRDPDEEETAVTAIGPVSERSADSIRDRAYLIVISGLNVGKMYRLASANEMVLGRSSGAHVRIEDDLVSRRHARIFHEGSELVLEDLNSANGIAVNGKRVQRHVLRDGDKIQIGDTTILKFTYTDKLDESFQRQMYDAALRDGLTGVFNKAFFMNRMGAEFAYARRHGTNLSILMMDIDHFKLVNDTHGHPAGDAVLKSVAQTIARTVRVEDVLSRYGGEEFVVICRGIETKNVAVLAERIRRSVESGVCEHGGLAIKVTISIGAASYPEHKVEKGNELVTIADDALYAAKSGGRNRIVMG
jgi:diguanylate cyclase (GGDEF)-like protein